MSTVTGRCYCGKIKIEYKGEPVRTALCHCDNCRHYTGSMYSNNYVIPKSNFKVIGTPKEISRTADSANVITNCFCPDCGTTLYRWGDAFGGQDGMRIIQAGVLDDVNVINGTEIVTEIFVPRRVKWVEPLGGVIQYEAMPPPS